MLRTLLFWTLGYKVIWSNKPLLFIIHVAFLAMVLHFSRTSWSQLSSGKTVKITSWFSRLTHTRDDNLSLSQTICTCCRAQSQASSGAQWRRDMLGLCDIVFMCPTSHLHVLLRFFFFPFFSFCHFFLMWPPGIPCPLGLSSKTSPVW